MKAGEASAIVIRSVESGDLAEWVRIRRALWPDTTAKAAATEARHLLAGFPSYKFLPRIPAAVARRG